VKILKQENNFIPFNRFNAPNIIKNSELKFYAVPNSIHAYLKDNCSNKLIIAIYIDLFEDNCKEFNKLPLSEYSALYNIGRAKFRKYLTELEKLKLIKLRKNKMEKNKLNIELIVEKSILQYEGSDRLSIKNSVETEKQDNILNIFKSESLYRIEESLHRLSDDVESTSQKENSDHLNNNINNNINNMVNVDHDHILNSSNFKKASTYTKDSSISREKDNIESLVSSTETLEKPYLKSECKNLGCTSLFLEKKEEKEEENMNNKDIRKQYKSLLEEEKSKTQFNKIKNEDTEWNFDKEYKYWEIHGKKKNELYTQLYNAIRPENKTIEIIDVVRTKKPKIHILNNELKNELEENYSCKKFDLDNNNFICYYLVKEEVDEEITNIKFIYDNVLIAYKDKIFSIDLYIDHIKTSTEHNIKPLEYKKKIIELILQNDKVTLRKYFKKWCKFAENYKDNDNLYAYTEQNIQKVEEKTDEKTNYDYVEELKELKSDRPYWIYNHIKHVLEDYYNYNLSNKQNTYIIYYHTQRKDNVEKGEKPFFYKDIMIQVGAEVFTIDRYLQWRDTIKPIEYKPSFKKRFMEYAEKKNYDMLWKFFYGSKRRHGFQKYHEEIVVIPHEQEKYKEKKQAEKDMNASFSQLDIGFDENTKKPTENLSTEYKTNYITTFRKDNIEAYKVVEIEANNIIRINERQLKTELSQEQIVDIMYEQIRKYEKIIKKAV
jgi:hypothetical protein